MKTTFTEKFQIKLLGVLHENQIKYVKDFSTHHNKSTHVLFPRLSSDQHPESVVFKVECVLPEGAWDHLPGQEGGGMTSRGIYSLDILNSYFCVRLRMSTWLSYSGIRLHLYTYDFATGNAQGGFREAADCFSEMPTGAFVCLNSLEIYETAFRDSES